MAKWNVTLAGETEPIEVTADGYQIMGNALAFFNRATPQMFQSPIFLVAYNNWILLEPVSDEIEV